MIVSIKVIQSCQNGSFPFLPSCNHPTLRFISQYATLDLSLHFLNVFLVRYCFKSYHANQNKTCLSACNYPFTVQNCAICIARSTHYLFPPSLPSLPQSISSRTHLVSILLNISHLDSHPLFLSICFF